MLDLPNLRTVLSQILSPSSLHTAALFTTTGQLVSFISDPPRSKDEVRVLVGLGSEVWQETKEQGFGTVDSELGRVLVTSVDKVPPPSQQDPAKERKEEPLLLLALNSEKTVPWSELTAKAQELIDYMEEPVSKLRAKLAVAPTSPILRPERQHR
ncbi:unnamed protein product [Somion occarium]|uniref:Roadblock/LAMTOR2 domain-containing protein n=1 Tax=Somion occarium TaxID=3059160 RepID=A0ABP1CJM2_9APHY